MVVIMAGMNAIVKLTMGRIIVPSGVNDIMAVAAIISAVTAITYTLLLLLITLLDIFKIPF